MSTQESGWEREARLQREALARGAAELRAAALAAEGAGDAAAVVEDLRGRLAAREAECARVAKERDADRAALAAVTQLDAGETDDLLGRWDQTDPAIQRQIVAAFAAKFSEAQDLADMGAAFKAFVHGYLDQHGVPHGDETNQHQREGCRIGARLDLLFAERDALKAATGEEIARGQVAFAAGEPCDPDVAKAGLGFAAGYWYSKAREAELNSELIDNLMSERDALQRQVEGHAERIAAQSELLSNAARKESESGAFRHLRAVVTVWLGLDDKYPVEELDNALGKARTYLRETDELGKGLAALKQESPHGQ